jgi:hypothetical protein
VCHFNGRNYHDHRFAAEFLQRRLEHLASEDRPLEFPQPLALLSGGVGKLALELPEMLANASWDALHPRVVGGGT